MSEITEELLFLILHETAKPFPNFNATGRRLLIEFRTTGEEQELLEGMHYCIN